MNLITYSIRPNGAHNFFRRLGKVFTRLGFSERPLQHALHAKMDSPQQYNGAPTFIIPAVALGRCISLIAEFARDGAEIGISQQTPQQVADFLYEQGNPHVYCTQENNHMYALYFDIPEGLGKTREEQLERSTALVQEVETLEAPLLRFGYWPDECHAEHSITGDIESVTVQDFFLRGISLVLGALVLKSGIYLNLITCAWDWVPSQHQTTLRLIIITSLE